MNWSRRQLKTIAAWVMLLITPLCSYLIFESITGNLAEIRGKYLLLNLMFFYLLYFVLFGITNSVRISYTFLNFALTILAIAEYYVVGFRTRPIMMWDVLAIQTAMTVSGNYEYEITPRLVILAGAAFVLCIFCCLFSLHFKKKRVWLLSAAGILIVSGGSLAAFYHNISMKPDLGINMWTPEISYEEKGFLLCTMRSFEYLLVKKPQEYTLDYLQVISNKIDVWKEGEAPRWASDTETVPTNIICIMNESFSDLSKVREFETDVPYLSFYNQLSENCVKGDLYMPVFGSMTSNSEFEFLTGNSMAYAPEGSVPYQIYMDKPVYSLPMTLKEQGYRTVAMHPYPGENWNRVAAYDAMGFDEFYDQDYYDDSPRIRGYVSDKGDYDKIIELTEEKPEGEPLFIFNVTMQNHGGYEEDYEATVHLTEYEDMPMTEQYLSLIKESDEALQYLLDYYSQVEEPTMIVMFGDHQPSVEPEFYESLYQASLDELMPEEILRRYITPFVVWTNYDTPFEQVDKLSAQYLSNVMMERANLEMTGYQYLLDRMSRQAPVVHMMGYYNKEGVWNSWTNWRDQKEYPILSQFGVLQYNNMFDKKHRMDSLFTIGGP